MKAILWFFCPFLANSVSAGRLELPANGLKGHCSTIELRTQIPCFKRIAFYHALC
jgi:hypothetical protein